MRTTCSLLFAFLTWALAASTAQADAAVVVLPADARAELIDALRVELRSRGYDTIFAETRTMGVAEGATRASALGAERDAAVVFWLAREEGEELGDVQVVRAVRVRASAERHAPLPEALDVVDARVFALAAASLLDDLPEVAPATPGFEEPTNPEVAPLQPEPQAEGSVDEPPSYLEVPRTSARPARSARRLLRPRWFTSLDLGVHIDAEAGEAEPVVALGVGARLAHRLRFSFVVALSGLDELRTLRVDALGLEYVTPFSGGVLDLGTHLAMLVHLPREFLGFGATVHAGWTYALARGLRVGGRVESTAVAWTSVQTTMALFYRQPPGNVNFRGLLRMEIEL